MHQQRGFTIIELMIVVTIVGTLAALAIPMYMDYATRAKIAEAGQLAPPVQTAVLDYYLHQGQFPADNAAVNLDPPSQLKGHFVSSIEVVDGTVVLTFGDPALAGRTVTLTPTGAGNAVSWACTTTLPDYLKPTSCA